MLFVNIKNGYANDAKARQFREYFITNQPGIDFEAIKL